MHLFISNLSFIPPVLCSDPSIPSSRMNALLARSPPPPTSSQPPALVTSAEADAEGRSGRRDMRQGSISLCFPLCTGLWLLLVVHIVVLKCASTIPFSHAHTPQMHVCKLNGNRVVSLRHPQHLEKCLADFVG